MKPVRRGLPPKLGVVLSSCFFFCIPASAPASDPASRGEGAQTDQPYWLEQLAGWIWKNVPAEGPGPNALEAEAEPVFLSGEPHTDHDAIPLRTVIDEGLSEYMALPPVQVLIGLERAAQVLSCCGIIDIEPGIEVPFLAEAAGALSHVERRPDWRDRILKAMATIEAARGNLSGARIYLAGIKDIIHTCEAVYSVAFAAYRREDYAGFEEVISEWIEKGDALLPRHRSIVFLGVGKALVATGQIERGEALVAEVVDDLEDSGSEHLGLYYRDLAFALARAGQPAQAIAAAKRADGVIVKELVDVLVSNGSEGAVASALLTEVMINAGSLRPDVRELLEWAGGLGQLDQIHAALPIEGRRPGVRDAIALGLVQGLLKAGHLDKAVQLASNPSGLDFGLLLDGPDIWLQAAAIGTNADILLSGKGETDNAALTRRLKRLEARATTGSARLALLYVYARHSEWELAAALERGVPEIAALRVEVAAGWYSQATQKVLEKPPGLTRGVMLFQVAEAEIRRRESLRQNEQWVPSSGKKPAKAAQTPPEGTDHAQN